MPGVAADKDAQCTEAVLGAFDRVREASGTHGWAKWRKLCQRNNWYRKHGAPRLNRVREALVKEGVLVEGYSVEEDGQGKEKRKKNGLYRHRDEDEA